VATSRRPRSGRPRARAAPRRLRTPLGSVALERFPGRPVRYGETERDLVRRLQARLNRLGCGPIVEDGAFGPQTEAAVRLFQARFPDADGAPMRIDGLVGSVTWAALFGSASSPAVATTGDRLLTEVLAVAASQIGVLEDPLGSNRGPQVDRYLRSAGLDPTRGSHPWCAAFVYFCFAEGSKRIGRKNPVVRTAAVLEQWDASPVATRIGAGRAHFDESVVRPGQIFVIDVGAPDGGGHTGLVESIAAGKLVTIEGNTNPGGSAEGIGVFRRRGRRIRDVNVGFLDYSRT
jgi:hypothetical protein